MAYRGPDGDLYPSKEWYDAEQEVRRLGLPVTTSNIKKARAGELKTTKPSGVYVWGKDPSTGTKYVIRTETENDAKGMVRELERKGISDIAYGTNKPEGHSEVGSVGEIQVAQPKQEDVQAKIDNITQQLQEKQQLLADAKAQGLEGSDQIPDNFYDELIDAINGPDEAERDKAIAEAEKYYGYTLPKDAAPYQYPEMLQEIINEAETARTKVTEDYTYQIDELNREKQQLLTEYNQYLEDIKTGKLRVGEDFQLAEARRLEQQTEFMQQKDFDLKRGLEQINRQWIGKGGLYSGPRREAVGEFQTQTEMEKQRYLSQAGYTGQVAETAYQRQLEDYTKQQQRGETAYGFGTQQVASQKSRYEQLKERSIQDIALQELKSKRSLQETFQEAIGKRTAQTLENKYI